MALPDTLVPSPTIYVVDDEMSIRETLRSFAESRGYRVIAFATARSFLDAYDIDLLSCLLLDLDLPGMSGLELQQELIHRGHQPPIIFVSGKGNITQSVQAMKSGAVDFIEKPFQHSDLFEKVEAALRTELTNRKELESEVAMQSRFSELTEREWDVLNSIVTGPKILSSKQVARELGVSHRTVEHHRSNIMKKTGSPTVADLIKLASVAGIASSKISNDQSGS